MGKHPISDSIKDQIFKLRQHGHSIPEMHRLLGVSKSTVSRYAKKVDILPEYKNRWLERRNASKIISEKAWKVANKASEEFIENLTDKDLKIIGATLYWAEGAKRELSFINSDPEMVRLFVKILTSAYGVPKSSIQVSLRLFEDISTPEALRFWSGITGIELKNDTFIDVREGSKKGKLPYGMCRVKVKKGGLLLKTFFAINKRVIAIASPRSSTDRAAAS